MMKSEVAISEGKPAGGRSPDGQRSQGQLELEANSQTSLSVLSNSWIHFLFLTWWEWSLQCRIKWHVCSLVEAWNLKGPQIPAPLSWRELVIRGFRHSFSEEVYFCMRPKFWGNSKTKLPQILRYILRLRSTASLYRTKQNRNLYNGGFFLSFFLFLIFSSGSCSTTEPHP